MTDKKDWRVLLHQIAPTLSAALGGPFAGMAMQVLTQHLLPDTDDIADETQLSAQLNAKTTDWSNWVGQVKAAEQKFALQMRELDLSVEKLDQMDRDSARDRQEKLGDQFPNFLGGIVIFGFFITVGFVLLGGLQHIEGSALTLIGTLIGYVSAKADQVIAFFFGSSSSSREKTRALTRAFQKK
ncbi:MAG: hypothetical protein ACON41_02015 [Parvibaculales bacterium]